MHVIPNIVTNNNIRYNLQTIIKINIAILVTFYHLIWKKKSKHISMQE